MTAAFGADGSAHRRCRALPAGEASRKTVHASMGLFGLALPFLSWPQAALCAIAAFGFNWLVLPRVVGHRLTSDRPDVSDRGVLLYPVVVLGLILVFRHHLALAAMGWGVLAFGDAAAGVVGQKWGRLPLPWSPSKSWEGLVAFVIGAFVGGMFLYAWFVAWQPAALVGMEVGDNAAVPATAMRLFFHQAGAVASLLGPAVVLAAILESAPHGLDDNVLPPFTVPLFFAVATVGWGFAGVPGALLPALAVNTLCAIVAAATKILRPRGIVVAWFLGLATWIATGPRGFALLLLFLVSGTAVTFVGYRRKRDAGLAEGREGRRGAAEIFGKGGVLLALCVFSLQQWRPLTGWAGHDLPTWAVVAVLAAALADTWGTEIGGLLGRRAYSLLPPRRVPPGTPGAVSVAGLVASVAGAGLIAGANLFMAWGDGPPSHAGDLRQLGVVVVAAFLATLVEAALPTLGPSTHLGRNLVVTLVAPLLAFILLGVLP